MAAVASVHFLLFPDMGDQSIKNTIKYISNLIIFIKYKFSSIVISIYRWEENEKQGV